MKWGTPMCDNVTALEGKYRDISMQHSCSRHAAWDPPTTNEGMGTKYE